MKDKNKAKAKDTVDDKDKYEVTGSAIPYYCEDLAMARRMALIFSTKTRAYVYIKKGDEVYTYAAGKEILDESPKEPSIVKVGD